MKRVVFLAVAAFCLIGLSDASAATLYVQSNVLRDDNGSCGGANRGKCTLTETGGAVSDNIKVKCAIKNATSGTYTVFWTCTNTARGCHNQACGFVSLGSVLVSGGRGSFTTTLANSPFPGKYVHLDLTGPDIYTAVYAGIPVGDGSAAAANGSPGDPTSR